jgi:predicted transcriptional regulator
MSEGIESQVYEFIKNMHNKGETAASRHVHFRFDIEIAKIEKILNRLVQKGLVSKLYDKEYQEDRFALISVKE